MSTQPQDIAGRTLSAGDSVLVIRAGATFYGQTLKIHQTFPPGAVAFTNINEQSGKPWGSFEPHIDLLKINPKPELTTWDNCAFQPEGITQ